jgi:hypothetical protein
MVDLGTAIATLKSVAAVVRESGKIDLTQQVIDLHQTLIALLADNAELVSKNRDLQEHMAEISAVLEAREAFVFDRNAYWRSEGQTADGPFCSRCFDADSKAVRLTQNTKAIGVCPNCKRSVRLDGPREPRPPVQRHMVHPGFVNSWREP